MHRPFAQHEALHDVHMGSLAAQQHAIVGRNRGVKRRCADAPHHVARLARPTTKPGQPYEEPLRSTLRSPWVLIHVSRLKRGCAHSYDALVLNVAPDTILTKTLLRKKPVRKN
jgi:hypothetical protein